MKKKIYEYYNICIDCGKKCHHQALRCQSCAGRQQGIRLAGKNKYSISKKLLIREYITKKKSAPRIAKELNCSSSIIYIRLKLYKIQRRTIKEAHKCIIRSAPAKYFCIDCGRILSRKAKRCRTCENKTERRKINLKKRMIGVGNFAYIDGRTSLYLLIRGLSGYKQWRKEVFKRDNFTCQECNKPSSGNLNSHHKKEFRILLENFLKIYDQFSPIEDKETLVRLAMKYQPFWDISNGQTLCKICHKKIHIIKRRIEK